MGLVYKQIPFNMLCLPSRDILHLPIGNTHFDHQLLANSHAPKEALLVEEIEGHSTYFFLHTTPNLLVRTPPLTVYSL